MNPIKFNFIWKIQALGWSYRVHLAGEKTNLQLTFNQKKLLRKHTRNLHSATTATSTTWSWWTAEPPVCFYKFNISRIPNTDNAAVTILYNDLFSVVHENEFSRNPSICVDVAKNCTIRPSSVFRYTSFNNYVNFFKLKCWKLCTPYQKIYPSPKCHLLLVVVWATRSSWFSSICTGEATLPKAANIKSHPKG